LQLVGNLVNLNIYSAVFAIYILSKNVHASFFP